MILAFLTCSVATARTLYVSPTGSGQDGETWDIAYTTIIQAVSYSLLNDVICIKTGTYTDPITIDKSIQLYGGFSGVMSPDMIDQRDFKNNPTVITVKNKSKVGIKIRSNCTIDGFVISDCDHPGFSILNNSCPILRNSIVKRCSSPTVGGGIAVNNASPEIIDCTITNNTSYNGGGLWIEGSSNVMLRRCTINNNSATNDGAWGGGILFVGDSLIMENCKVGGNYARLGESLACGGGLLTNGGNILIYNSFFGGNLADRGFGSQIYTLNNISFIAENCTIIGDEKAISWQNAPPNFNNSILWGANNMCVPDMDSTGNPEINYSCIQGGYSGIGNISDDPLFRDPSVGDFRLQPDSPCVDTAATSGPSDDLNGNPRPVDIAGIGREATDAYDMGAYEFQEWELPVQTGVGNWNLYEARN